ncbi:hypothetical protein VKS41_001392 [Umbelopsis sp. WA50703]
MPVYHAHQRTAIPPTAIQQIVYANLLNDAQDYLIFAKGSWLQLLQVVADGPLKTVFEQCLQGTISAIAKISCNWTLEVPENLPTSTPSKRPYTCSVIPHAPIASNDMLVATSDQGSLVFLTVVVPDHGDLADNGRFELVAEVPLNTPGNDYDKVGRKMAVDPMSRAVAVAAYQDKFDVFMLNPAVSRTRFNPIHSMLSVQEQGIIYQMEFLHTIEQSKMYLLVTFYNDIELVCRIVAYAIDTSNPENMTIERYGRLPIDQGGPLPLLLIPVPSAPEAFILVTENQACYLTVDDIYSGNVLHPTTNIPAGLYGESVIFTAYTILFNSSLADAIIYLGTSDGDFYALDSRQLEWEYLGQRNNIGVAMQYLGSTITGERRRDVIVYAGEGADHEVIEIDLCPKESSIQHLQTLENRAPLTDGQLTQDPHSSLDVLYVCSGQHRHGTLREIRSGIGIELLSVSPSDPQWEGVTDMWQLSTSTSGNEHLHLVMSFAGETRILSNINDAMEDVTDTCGFVSDKPTIFVGIFESSGYVQVLKSSIVICSMDTQLRTRASLQDIGLPAAAIITHATLDRSTLILCTCNLKNERSLVRLHITDMSINIVNTISLARDISFMSLISIANQPPLLVLGTHDPCVYIYNSVDFRVIYRVLLANVSMAGTNVPESCAVLSNAFGDFMLIGLRDGTLISYRVYLLDGAFTMQDPIVRSLGTLPIKLVAANNQACLAVSDNLYYIEQHNQRIVVKTVNTLDVGQAISVIPLYTSNMLQCYAALMDQKLCIISLDSHQDINIRSTLIGDTPRRVLHDKPTNSLIVAYSGRSSSGRQDGLHLINGGRIVATTKMAEHEIICALEVWCIEHQGKTYRYICVGIATQTSGRHHPQVRRPTLESGRLLLYRLKPRKVDKQFSLSEVWHEDNLPAGVFAICPHSQGLLFSTGRTLHLHQLDISNGRLAMVAQETARSPITLIKVDNDRICVGTQLDSLSFYRYDAATSKLIFVKSDALKRTISGATMPHENLIIGTERYGGVFSLIDDTDRPAYKLLPLAFGFQMPDIALGVHSGTLSMMDHQASDYLLSWDETTTPRKAIFACTLSGGVVVVRRITEPIYNVLRIIELRLRMLNCSKVLGTIYKRNESIKTLDGNILLLFTRMTIVEQTHLVPENDKEIEMIMQSQNVTLPGSTKADRISNLLASLQYL